MTEGNKPASLADIDSMITECRSIKDKIEALDAEKKALNEQMSKLEYKIEAELEKNGLSTFKGNAGTMTIASRWSVKMPKDPEQRDALRQEMEARGAFDSLWTFNHQSLNAWVKEEKQRAEAEGKMFDIDGLAPVEDKYLQFRKA